MNRGFAIALLLFVALNSQINDATDENQVEIAQLCTIYKLLTEPLPEQKIQEPSASSTDQAPHDTMSQVLNRALKLNLTVAEEPVDVVFRNTEKYKTKKDVDNDADKKGYLKLENDGDLKKLRQLYKEVLGTDSGKQGFSRTYQTPLSPRTKNALRNPIAHLYKKLLEIHTKFTENEEELIADTKEARLKLMQAATGDQLKAMAAQTMTAITPVPDITAETLPWDASADRDGNCKAAGETKNKAGMALATDMLCICFAKKKRRTHILPNFNPYQHRPQHKQANLCRHQRLESNTKTLQRKPSRQYSSTEGSFNTGINCRLQGKTGKKHDKNRNSNKRCKRRSKSRQFLRCFRVWQHSTSMHFHNNRLVCSRHGRLH
uniref:Variant surface glycoprotein n=1 Tax=Trypanosoma brucei TaxID=5691 RepID=A0A1V0FY48_9TRYP|nr:variant surface glycoprotein [Trypanosoma brucei]